MIETIRDILHEQEDEIQNIDDEWFYFCVHMTLWDANLERNNVAKENWENIEKTVFNMQRQMFWMIWRFLKKIDFWKKKSILRKNHSKLFKKFERIESLRTFLPKKNPKSEKKDFWEFSANLSVNAKPRAKAENLSFWPNFKNFLLRAQGYSATHKKPKWGKYIYFSNLEFFFNIMSSRILDHGEILLPAEKIMSSRTLNVEDKFFFHHQNIIQQNMRYYFNIFFL